MYFPYLRGKQFELLALRELVPELPQPTHLYPVIEPVRLSTAGLKRCLDMLGSNTDSVLILNPQVGELQEPIDLSSTASDFLLKQRTSTPRVGAGIILHPGADPLHLLRDFRSAFGTETPLTLIHSTIPKMGDDLLEMMTELDLQRHIIDLKVKKRHYRSLRKDGTQIVPLEDVFPKAQKNADYIETAGTLFSEEHLYFLEDGYDGFADYVTIGEAYIEGGFTPRVVAIHWTFEEDDNTIAIRHFASSNSQGTANVGGKFLEAAAKLVTFLDEENIQTHASNVIRSHVANQTYPGLGILKKLSIQNHLELVSTILNR